MFNVCKANNLCLFCFNKSNGRVHLLKKYVYAIIVYFGEVDLNFHCLINKHKSNFIKKFVYSWLKYGFKYWNVIASISK
jgi:hypothetical protein